MQITKYLLGIFIANASIISSAQAITLKNITLLSKEEPRMGQKDAMTQLTFHVENEHKGEPDYDLIKSIHGDITIFDMDGYMTMRVVTRWFQDQVEQEYNRLQPVDSKQFYQDFANHPIPHWQDIFHPLLERALSHYYLSLKKIDPDEDLINCITLSTQTVRRTARDYTEAYFPHFLREEISLLYKNDPSIRKSLEQIGFLEKAFSGMGHLADITPVHYKQSATESVTLFGQKFTPNFFECHGVFHHDLSSITNEQLLNIMGSPSTLDYTDQNILKNAILEDLALAHALLFWLPQEDITYGQYFKVMGNFLTLTSTSHTYPICDERGITPSLAGLCTYKPHKLKKSLDPQFKNTPHLSLIGDTFIHQLRETVKPSFLNAEERAAFGTSLGQDFPYFKPLYDLGK